MSSFPPGWYPDPILGAPAVRFWDGSQWTAQVMGPSRPPKPPFRTLPPVVAIGALLSVALPLLLSRLILRSLAEFKWPIAVYVILLAVLAYGPPLMFWRYAISRWGTGAFRADVGFSTRRSDFGWGPITWLCCLGTQLVCGIVVALTRLPIEGNTQGIGDARDNPGYVIPMLIVAVIAAPFVEEIVFRGMVLRGLLSTMPPVAAIGVQAVLFGAAHFAPERGLGNLGLILILSGVGAALGTAAYLFRRLAPSIIAHAIINSIAMVVALVR